MSFEFENAYVLHSNLGGKGPDTSAPPSIRFVNALNFYTPETGQVHVDLEVTARSDYTPFNAALNGKVGAFARINLAANRKVDLRVSMLRSCASAPSCVACETGDLITRTRCYAAGCACYGVTVFAETECSGAAKAAKQAAYSSSSCGGGAGRRLQTLRVPREAVITMSVYDFDRGPSGDYLEQLLVPKYKNYKTPLRAASGNPIVSTVFVGKQGTMFTSTAAGSTADNPTNPKSLTDEQAAKAISFFFTPSDGYVDATFSVSYTGTASPEGRNLLFAGDSALCEPPPPMPPAAPRMRINV